MRSKPLRWTRATNYCRQGWDQVRCCLRPSTTSSWYSPLLLLVRVPCSCRRFQRLFAWPTLPATILPPGGKAPRRLAEMTAISWLPRPPSRRAACLRSKLQPVDRKPTTHERAFHKCLADLLKLRSTRQKIEFGFESEKRRSDRHKHFLDLKDLDFTYRQMKILDVEHSRLLAEHPEIWPAKVKKAA